MTDYGVFIQRIIDILNTNSDFTDSLGEPIRFGDMPSETYMNNPPLCYVSTARTMEVSSKAITPWVDNKRGAQEREIEFWVIIMTLGETPGAAQKQLYTLTEMARDTLESNRDLRDPDPKEDDGGDPILDRLCGTSQVFLQGRNERQRGSMVEAMTLRVRCTVVTDPV